MVYFVSKLYNIYGSRETHAVQELPISVNDIDTTTELRQPFILPWMNQENNNEFSQNNKKRNNICNFELKDSCCIS